MNIRKTLDWVMAEVRRIARKVDGLSGPGVVNTRETLTFNRATVRVSPQPSPRIYNFFWLANNVGTTGAYGVYFVNYALQDHPEEPFAAPPDPTNSLGGGTTLQVNIFFDHVFQYRPLVAFANMAEHGQSTYGMNSSRLFTIGTIRGTTTGGIPVVWSFAINPAECS